MPIVQIRLQFPKLLEEIFQSDVEASVPEQARRGVSSRPPSQNTREPILVPSERPKVPFMGSG